MSHNRISFCFCLRRVVIYKALNRSEVYTLALLGNELAGTIQHTKPYDMLLVMRKELLESFNGKFSSEFQEHIYKIFNAVVSLTYQINSKYLLTIP